MLRSFSANPHDKSDFQEIGCIRFAIQFHRSIIGSVISVINCCLFSDPVNCSRRVYNDNSQTHYCNAFYSQKSCATLSEIQYCESKSSINFPVIVKYESDGRVIQGVESSYHRAILGFKLKYNFIDCPSSKFILNH